VVPPPTTPPLPIMLDIVLGNISPTPDENIPPCRAVGADALPWKAMAAFM